MKRKEYTNGSQQLELSIYFSMNKQYMEGVQNGIINSKFSIFTMSSEY